ncbi:hypothetical protein [Rhizobium leguminosarum]|uniref:hypothetical protein n=1 Tax=Rhizobium leguminosarum TaxID=384 RepID=UPI001FE07E35|nr:hypothetical protein [Rhizobium leguminosarum]
MVAADISAPPSPGIVAKVPAPVGGRLQIKASFLEDDRAFRTVKIQKFNVKGQCKGILWLLA